MEVGALALDGLMLLAEQSHRFPTAVTALLATTHHTLRLLELLLATPMQPWILNHVTLGGDEEHLQANVYARLASGGGKRLGRPIGARENGIPAVSLFADGDGLGRAFQRAAPAHCDATNRRQDEAAIGQPCAVVVLRIGERVVAVAPLVARIACCFTCFCPAEECLKRAVYTQHH